VAILVIRAFLSATGYPRLGGSGLYIAHMLWGGLLMLAASVLLLALLGSRSLGFAAALAGIELGTFIDELGRFISEWVACRSHAYQAFAGSSGLSSCRSSSCKSAGFTKTSSARLEVWRSIFFSWVR